VKAPGGKITRGEAVVRVRLGDSAQQKQMWTLRMVGQQIDALGKEILGKAAERGAGSTEYGLAIEVALN